MTTNLCPFCGANGQETPSEDGPKAMRVALDVGNTEMVTGTLCRECREAGVVSEAEMV